jgi:hypothetical protein
MVLASPSDPDLSSARLTIAGGYDPNISENVAYESELKIFAQDK